MMEPKLKWETLLCEGRRRPSRALQEDGRSEFERDHDRAVFSTPVRRLQDKTQVFPLEPNDAVRTRLTHSLEVATLARGLARGVAVRLESQGEINASQARAIESIAATCGLIHDLGNPPFGHAGEKAISSWFAAKKADEGFFTPFKGHPRQKQLEQDFLNFEGNAQMLRIVSKLQLLADPNGLNLTYGTLSAAMKYTAASDDVRKKEPHEKEKPGYFASEQELVDEIRQRTGTGDARNPIAFLVEACDDMVYATVDIEDGVKKGIVGWQEVEQALREALKDASTEFTEEQCEQAGRALEERLGEVRKYIDRANPPLRGKARDAALAHHFRTLIIGATKAAILECFQRHYTAIMNGEYHGELIKDSGVAALIGACKSVGLSHIYCSEETLRLETLGRRVIHDLMDFFWEGAAAYESAGNAPKTKTFEGKIYRLFSDNYRTVFEEALKTSTLPPRYHQFQLVTDYVCGMTDSFACKLHSQLTHG